MKLKERKEPWKATFYFIKLRIKRKDSSYYFRGIKCLITAEELKILWFRDKAYLMDKPSIDRKENEGNYTFKNCQYIEHKENCKKQSNTLKRKKNSYKLGKALWRNASFRKKMSIILSASLKKRWENPVYRKKMSETFKNNWKNINLRRKMTRRISENSKRMWQTPGFKKRRSKEMILFWKKRR